MKKRRYYGRITAFFAVILAIMLILSVYTFFKIRPLIIRYAESNAETILLNAANDAVVRILSENGISYNEIVILTKDSEEKVSSLEIDTTKINVLKSSISSKISEITAEKEHYDIHIPLGTFFGSEYTTGLGPRIRFPMQLTSTTVVDFKSNFYSAGINQVLHQIIITMRITGSLIMTGYTGAVSLSTTAIAAQTVIVGVAPGAFTEVIEAPFDDTAGLINDYGYGS